MKKILIVIWILVILPALAASQEKIRRTSARGYAFISPGVAIGGGSTTGFLHFGGGVEARLYKGLGIGGELGYLAPFQYTSMGVGLLSLDGLYYFEKAGTRAAPFVTGGYSLVFRNGHANAMNFGGGFDYWFRDKLGLRFEVRDHFSPQYFSDHLIQARFGIVFR